MERCIISGMQKSSLWVQKQYGGFTVAALLCSSAAGTLFLPHIFFLFIEMSCMKTNRQPDTSDASQGEKYWDQYWSKSSLTAWATEWSAKSMDGPTLGCVEGMGKHYWAAIQRELSTSEERVNKEPYAEPHQSKFKVLQLGSKNPYWRWGVNRIQSTSSE